jgi:hypothetical protein
VLAIVGLLAIGAVVAYLVLDGFPKRGSGGGTPTGGGPVAASVHLSAVTAYDPFGTNGENNSKAYLATDGSSSTYWETERYYDAPSLNKQGVGLVLDAGKPVQLHQLGFSTATPGLTAEILAGDSRTGPFLDDVVGASQVVPANGQARYTISGGKHRYYVIWITRLGPGPTHTAQINTVAAN